MQPNEFCSQKDLNWENEFYLYAAWPWDPTSLIPLFVPTNKCVPRRVVSNENVKFFFLPKRLQHRGLTNK